MNLILAAVGKVREPSIAELCRQYARRLENQGHTFAVREVKEERGAATDKLIVSRESVRLKEALPAGAWVVALDSSGENCPSTELAARLERLALGGQSRLAFVIGGHLGLARELVSGADWVLSLSRMTLTHEMARLLLLEQLYRAGTILRGEPYHK